LLSYVRYGDDPTDTDFDYQAVKDDSSNSIRICSSAMRPGRWVIGVQNQYYRTSNYTLTTNLIGACSFDSRPRTI